MQKLDSLENINIETIEYSTDIQNEGVCKFLFKPDHYALFTKLKNLLDNECFHLENLDISTQVIDLNPQHYTAWYFRRKIIRENYVEHENKAELLREELRFVRGICERAPKCYQSWWHMRVIRELLGFDIEELKFLSKQLEFDAKNMYVWNHRTWFIRKYNSVENDLLFSELDFISKLISEDCRNNSAWCYRHFIFTNLKKMNVLKESDLLEEVDYIVNWLMFAPHNDSIWNYIISFFSKIMVNENVNKETLIKNLSLENAPKSFIDAVDKIYTNNYDSCHQVVYIKACMEYEKGDTDFALKSFKLLQSLDPIRKFYWKWRADNLKI
ncbi:Protein prenyltransferase alpha subunit repeat family protein [Cryptosporidium meleagridis]|uniref:Protein farnesyltransferase/geranylgeranyltransferase type-1 subunit alpha n=1 Tax=Cryptosporidium meleagridis TaxID=93969 RepID=A0A2P4Z3B6_9CRYT|nr:Protein prenyltransferase alpha subunit repeat family protein [Cryptosporidium meleagridis]